MNSHLFHVLFMTGGLYAPQGHGPTALFRNNFSGGQTNQRYSPDAATITCQAFLDTGKPHEHTVRKSGL